MMGKKKLQFYTHNISLSWHMKIDQFQMRAQAYDLGTPQLTGSEVNVTVFVTRNNNPPFFINAPYIATLDETANFGTFVYDTSAADSDTVVGTSVLGKSNRDYARS